MNEEWYKQLAESIAENKGDAVTNLIAEPYFDEVLKDIVKCQNLLRIAGVEHNHNGILNLLLEKMSIHRHIAAGIVEDVCEKGHLDVVKSLLKANAFDANAIRSQRWLLANACLSGNIDLVTFFINMGAEPSWLALNVACKSGVLDAVKLLIENGVDFNDVDPFSGYESPFASAIEGNSIDVLNYLLLHHNDKLGNLFELFPYICKTDNPDILRVFIDNRIDILSKNDVAYYRTQTSYLEQMMGNICLNGSIELLDYVLNNIEDASVNMPLRKFDVTTALHLASSTGNVDLFERLLARGADVSAFDSQGITPLHIACKYNHLPIVQLLLVHGSKNDAFNVNAIDKDNNTALNCALNSDAPEADILHMVNQLVVHGANININSPLTIAIVNNYLDVVNALLDLNPDLNQENSYYGYNPLGAATLDDQTEVVRRLLKLRADPNIMDTSGFTPLMRAAQNNNIEIVTLLLQQDSIDSSKRTPDGYSAADMARSLEMRELINQHVKLSQDAELSQGSSSSSRPPL